MHRTRGSKHIIKLVKPNRREDEIQFDKDCSKRQNTTQHNGYDGIHVPDLLRDGSWDLVDSDWVF
eukprot:27637_6